MANTTNTRNSNRNGGRNARGRRYSAHDAFLAELDRSARFLVTHNGYVVAAFADCDDALMFEGDLAEIDGARGTEGASCEVVDRKGRRIGGYWVSRGRTMSYLGD